MGDTALALAGWASGLDPTPEDLELARRSLVDTVAVTLAARDEPMRTLAAELPPAARWAAMGHVLDYDDLHMESTTHISVVCVPAVLSCDGDARAYLAAAGVMARLGMTLGWPHYEAGWHATCTAGAPAAAAGAGVALGLSEEQLAHAMALAVPAAGGVQRAFGTAAKSLQVGFAAHAGVRAARLVRAGASADSASLDQWLELVRGDASMLDLGGPAVPGGLAVKVFPCCYALQRPISALQQVLDGDVDAEQIARIVVRTPEETLRPLIHDRPTTGLEGKFSLQYAIAATVLDGYPGARSFTDEAVNRPDAQDLVQRVEVETTPGGDWLLAGEVEITVERSDGSTIETSLKHPPGSPARPPDDADLDAKLADCGKDVPALVADLSWSSAAELLQEQLGRGPVSRGIDEPTAEVA